MVEFKLANIMLEKTDRFFNFTNLYLFTTVFPSFDDNNACVFPPFASLDFASYYNSFSNKKWRRYTAIDNVHFRMDIKGSARIDFFDVKLLDIGLHRQLFATIEVHNDCFAPVEFEFPETDAELVAFRISTLSDVACRNGYYYTLVDESRIRDVHLAISTTTYKKEEWIKANVQLMNDDVFHCEDACAGNVSMIIIDNGNTLDSSELTSEYVHVFPNKNVGGAGGFARGMIEAKRLNCPVTHVLVMDDDVSISSESIKRTYNLLSLVSDSYLDAFISGAMFSLGDQSIQVEDIGFADYNGNFGPVKTRKNMNILYDIVKNEDDLPPRENMYAAFWYCCIPMTTIEHKGLPLPLFIRYDDAEYGMRCNPRFMSMNGINVWHMDFTDRYNAFYERFCGTRNALIIQATSGVCKSLDFFEKKFNENFKRELKKFNYGSAELLLDAVDDFLRGPECIAVEQCEKVLKRESAKTEKLKPIEEIDFRGISLTNLNSKSKRGEITRFLDAITWNGQRFTPSMLKIKQPVAVRFDPNEYAGTRFHFRENVLSVDRLQKHGFFSRFDKKAFDALYKRYKKTMKEYRQNHEKVEKMYAANREYLVSEEFWKSYLNID